MANIKKRQKVDGFTGKLITRSIDFFYFLFFVETRNKKYKIEYIVSNPMTRKEKKIYTYERDKICAVRFYATTNITRLM